ncbi:hypothetical protein Peur_030657 [Populus x canadensis]
MTADGRRFRTASKQNLGSCLGVNTTMYKLHPLSLSNLGNKMFGENRSKTMRVPLKGLPLLSLMRRQPVYLMVLKMSLHLNISTNSLVLMRNAYKSVHERIRVPVSYDDLLGDDLKNEA